MSDVPVDDGDNYNVTYIIQSGVSNSNYCAEDKTRTSSDSGKTKTYTVSGTTVSNSCDL